MKPLHVLILVAATAVLVALLVWDPFRGEDTPPPGWDDTDVARGVVFLDDNGNGLREEGEPGLKGVRVSDQRSVTKTDEKGRWVLPAHDEAIYFVVKPRGYMTPLSDDNLPRFFYIHKTTPTLPLEGPTLQPTGPLPASVDFPLVRRPEPDRFDAVVMGDPQPRSEMEVDYLAHDVLEELVGTTAAFAVVLGDISFDNHETYGPYNRATGTVGIPFYNVLGNHDANYDGMDTHQHYDTWRTIYGPRYYSFDYGPVHFMVLSDVIFPEKGTRYQAGLGEQQLDWIEEDLAHVSPETLVVLTMHIPLRPAEANSDFARLYELLQDFPHTLSFSAHSHVLQHGFLREEHGWKGAEPHHHINAGASCGRWWGGALDETDIPHATGSDGTPNGYFVVSFAGNRYSTRYKAARKPATYQMEIQAPHAVAVSELADTPVLVNVFNGNERSRVEMALDHAEEWVPMEHAPQVDPLYARITERESGKGASVSQHMWEARLPADLPVGSHLIRIRATDMHGQEFTDSRILRVRGG